MSRGILFISILLTQLLHAQETLQKSLEFEQTVAEHLKTELDKILPESSFVVVPSVKLKKVRSKVLSQSENFQQTKTEKNQEPPSLPGFDDMKEDSNQSHQKSRNVYEFKDDIKVESIAIKVITEKSLPKKLVNLAKKTLRAKVKASFGKGAKISFSSSDIVQSRKLYEHDANWNSLKAAFMGNWKSFLAILAIGLLLLFGTIYFIMALKRKLGGGYAHEPIRDVQPLSQPEALEEPKDEVIETPLLLDSEGQKNAKVEYEENLDTLVSQLTVNPSLSTSFISMQKSEDIQRLLQCTDNSSLLLPLSDMFPQGTDFAQIGTYEPTEDFEHKNNVVNQFNKDLAKYKRVYEYSIGQKFGFLSTMTARDAKSFLADLTDREIIAVYRSLERNFASKVLAEFDSERKTRIAMALQEAPISSAQLTALESSLRLKFESEEVIGQSNFSKNDLLHSMIEGEEDPRELILALSETNPEISEQYRKYLISFKDVLNETDQLFNEVLEEVSNETLAMAMAGLDESERSNLTSLFPEARAKIISSLELSLNGSRTTENIQLAQREIMKTYRNYERAS